MMGEMGDGQRATGDGQGKAPAGLQTFRKQFLIQILKVSLCN